jgi:enoyl-CoA hydratase/carnithine racemase
MSDHLLFEVREGIGRVTFNRPEARNAFTLAMYDRIEEIVQQAESDASVRALVLTGAGEQAFAAGTDISEFKAFSKPEDGLRYEARMDEVLTTLERSTVPTIAAISGVCTGGGAAIAGCCDLRIGAANMRFGLPMARTLGNCLSVANCARMAALLGPARVMDIIFTARLIEAEEARAIGLVSEVLPDHTSLMSRAEELARTVAEHAPLTLRATKEALRRIREKMTLPDDSDLIRLCYTSKDFREGMDAFLNKRKPDWKGM